MPPSLCHSQRKSYLFMLVYFVMHLKDPTKHPRSAFATTQSNSKIIKEEKGKQIYFKAGLNPSWVCNRYTIAKIGVVQIGKKTKRFRLTSWFQEVLAQLVKPETKPEL